MTYRVKHKQVIMNDMLFRKMCDVLILTKENIVLTKTNIAITIN